MIYLNNCIKPDHAPIKKIIEATGVFKVRKRAWLRVQGFEGDRGQFEFWLCHDDLKLMGPERSLIFLEFTNERRCTNRHLRNIFRFCNKSLFFNHIAFIQH